eukprot:781368-Amphidinium_carterae.2
MNGNLERVGDEPGKGSDSALAHQEELPQEEVTATPVAVTDVAVSVLSLISPTLLADSERLTKPVRSG